VIIKKSGIVDANFIKGLRKANKVGAKDLDHRLKVSHTCNRGYDLHYRREKTGQAIKILKKALEKIPDKIEFHIALARIYEDKNDLISKIEEIEKIIPLEKEAKKKAEWLLIKGDALKNSGDYQRVEEILQESIDLRPDYAKSYARRAYLRARQGKDELALEDWEKAEALGYQGSGPLYLLFTALYLNRGNHPQVLKTIDKILARHPSQVKDLFGLFPTKEGYNLLFYKIFNQLRSVENPLSEEKLIRILREAVLNRKLALEVLKKLWMERTAKIEREFRRRKKVKRKDRRILNFIEKIEEEMASFLKKEREEARRFMRLRKSLVEALRLIAEKKKKEDQVVREFIDQYRDFIDLEEFQFQLNWVRRRGRATESLLKEIEEAIRIFLEAFCSKHRELVVSSIKLEEEPAISRKVRVIGEGGIEYSISFFFNLASEVSIDWGKMEQTAIRFAEEAELWANLPEYLASGLILKLPEDFNFKEYLSGQKPPLFLQSYDYQIIEVVDRESINLIVDVLKAQLRPKRLEKELKFLKDQEIPHWEELLAREENHLLKELPVLAREVVALEMISEITSNKKLQVRLGKMLNKYEELMETVKDYAQFEEVYRYYRDYILKNLYMSRKVKKEVISRVGSGTLGCF